MGCVQQISYYRGNELESDAWDVPFIREEGREVVKGFLVVPFEVDGLGEVDAPVRAERVASEHSDYDSDDAWPDVNEDADLADFDPRFRDDN